MYNNNEYNPHTYESNYEFDHEQEFDFEGENYENESGYGFENEYDNEFNYELENEFDNEQEEEYNLNSEYDFEADYESENEDEAGMNWQNEVRVRDRRTGSGSAPGTRGAYRSTAPRQVVVPTRSGTTYRPPMATASRPRPGYRPPYRPAAFKSPYKYPFRTPGRPPIYNQRGSYPQLNRRWWPFKKPYPRPGVPPWPYRYPRPSQYIQPAFNQFSQTAVTDPYYPPTASTADASGQATSGGGIPNYILETIKNLSQQMASTNQNVEAIQQLLLSQNKQDGSTMPPPESGTPPLQGTPPNSGAANTELEMGDYEYDLESETMNYEEGEQEIIDMEMATELLAINNEQELDNFLSSFLNGGLKKLMKGIIKKTLPVAGAAAGSFFGGPMGAKVGQKIGNAAANTFELELEGLSHEDQELEVAKAIIRLANDAASELEYGERTGDPNEDVKKAFIQAAIRNAPGLLIKKSDRNANTTAQGRY